MYVASQLIMILVELCPSDCVFAHDADRYRQTHERVWLRDVASESPGDDRMCSGPDDPYELWADSVRPLQGSASLPSISRSGLVGSTRSGGFAVAVVVAGVALVLLKMKPCKRCTIWRVDVQTTEPLIEFETTPLTHNPISGRPEGVCNHVEPKVAGEVNSFSNLGNVNETVSPT